MEKRNFTGVKATPLITLYAKALEGRIPESLPRDHWAAEAARIDYDFAALRRKLYPERDGYRLVGSIRAAGARTAWSLDQPRDLEARIPGLKLRTEEVMQDACGRAQRERLTRTARVMMALMRRIGPLRRLRYRYY